MAIGQIKPEDVALKLCERDTNHAIGCHTEIWVEGPCSDAANKLTPINKSCRTHQKRTPAIGNTSLPHNLPDGLRVVGLFTCKPLRRRLPDYTAPALPKVTLLCYLVNAGLYDREMKTLAVWERTEKKI